MVKSAFVGRLLSQHGFGEHPSYAAVPIERPLFVVGLPRTGTTAIHRLLTADARHQGLELWLSEYPQPRPPRETWEQNPVFHGINAAYAQHHVANQEFLSIHSMDSLGRASCRARACQNVSSSSY